MQEVWRPCIYSNDCDLTASHKNARTDCEWSYRHEIMASDIWESSTMRTATMPQFQANGLGETLPLISFRPVLLTMSRPMYRQKQFTTPKVVNGRLIYPNETFLSRDFCRHLFSTWLCWGCARSQESRLYLHRDVGGTQTSPLQGIF